MCFQKHPTGGGHRWLRASPRNGCLAPYTTGNSKTIGAGRVGKRQPKTDRWVVGDGDGGDDFVGCFFGGFMI